MLALWPSCQAQLEQPEQLEFAFLFQSERRRARMAKTLSLLRRDVSLLHPLI